MVIIPLIAVPNQTFSIQLDGTLFNLTLKSVVNFTAVTIFQNNVLILSGMRAVAGTPVIPYQYLEAGNFIFVTANEEYPVYTEFGSTQYLFYLTQAELEALRETSV